jgi:hypothetical protein
LLIKKDYFKNRKINTALKKQAYEFYILIIA